MAGDEQNVSSLTTPAAGMCCVFRKEAKVISDDVGRGFVLFLKAGPNLVHTHQPFRQICQFISSRAGYILEIYAGLTRWCMP